MKRAKYSEVPKEYRRNYIAEFVELCIMFAVCVFAVAIILFLLFFF